MKNKTWNEIAAVCMGYTMLATGMKKDRNAEEVLSRLRGMR